MESIIQDLFWNGWRNTFSIAESFEKKKCDNKDPTACEEFFLVAVQAHIVCLVMKEFQLSSVNDTPSCKQFSKEQFLDQSSERRQQIFLEFISKLVSDYTHIPEMEKTQK